MNTKLLNVAVDNREALLGLTLTLTGKWTHTARDVTELAERAEETLNRMWMPKGKRKSIVAIHSIKGPGARAYRFGVNGSIVTLRRAATGWRVIGFASKRVFPQQGGQLILQISPEQEAATVAAMRAACGVVVKRAVAEMAPAAVEIASASLEPSLPDLLP